MNKKMSTNREKLNMRHVFNINIRFWEFLEVSKNVFRESTKVFKFHNFKIHSEVMNKEFYDVKTLLHIIHKNRHTHIHLNNIMVLTYTWKFFRATFLIS